MNIIKFDIYKNNIKRRDGFNPVTTEKNYTVIKCYFKSDDWKRCSVITASFMASIDNIIHTVSSVDDDMTSSFYIPEFDENVSNLDKLFFSVSGTYDDNGKTITLSSNIIEIDISKGIIFREKADSALYEQVVSLLNTNGEKINIIENSNLSAERFGAKGDGITDDTAALQAMFDYASKNDCAISLSANKIYIVSNTLRYDTKRAKFNGNLSTIKVADNCQKRDESYFGKEQPVEGKWSLNSVITINVMAGENAKYNKGVFENLQVDCNIGQAKHGIKIENEGKTLFSNLNILNPALYGIRVYGGGEATFTCVHGCRSKLDSLASTLITKGWNSADERLKSTMLYLGCADTYVDNCVSIDFETGFLTGGADNHFTKCHAWCAFCESVMKKASSFVVWGGISTFVQCTVDSTKFGYKFYNLARAAIVCGMNAYNDLYTKDCDVPLLFYFEKDSVYKSEFCGANTIIASSNFKVADGLGCIFDNLTDENDNKLSIDYKPEGEFESVHVIELSDTYSKSEIDAELAKKINEEDVYTTEEADDHFQRILTAGDNIKIDDNKQGKITISADLSKKYDAANVESGSGDLSLYSENVPVTSAKFNYQKVGDFVMLTFTVTFSAATMSAAKSYSLLGLPYRNNIILRKPAITTSKNKLGIAIAANTATLTIITQGEAVTISDGESIQETLIYKIQK